MAKETKAGNQSDVDKGLVAMFLRLSPEERLLANDNALRTILELRHAYKQGRIDERKYRRNSLITPGVGARQVVDIADKMS